VDLDRAIGELNTKYSFAKNISGRGGGGSDHAPFYNAKVPVVCLHTGMHRQYHTPDDTADRINYKGLEQIARYAFELSFKVASGGDAPKFNYAEFKAMEYSHDHGYAGSPFHKEK
jgi:Zn-dependent M28 family amino/carboxypeptidase